MALKHNEFTGALNTFLTEMVQANFLSFAANGHAKRESDRITALLKKDGNVNALMTGAVLVSIDPFSKDARDCTYGGYLFKGKRLLALVDETHRRYQAQVLCLAFEATEKFLRSVGGELLWQKRRQIVIQNKVRLGYEKAVGKSLPSKGTKPYYVEFAKYLCRRNTDDVLKILRKHVPDFEARGTKFFWNIDLFLLFDTIAFCRHAVVHSNGRYSSEAVKKLTADQQRDVGDLSHKSEVTSDVCVMPDRPSIEEYLQRLTDFVYILYRTASDACGMEIDYEPA
jgi:hypothetical protein